MIAQSIIYCVQSIVYCLYIIHIRLYHMPIWNGFEFMSSFDPVSPSPYLCLYCRIFGFVARKTGSAMDNVCHLFAEHDPEQPASAIVNFVSKVMIGSQK